MSEYEKQAQDFIDSHGIRFKATFKGDKCPMWDDDKHIHGDRYLVMLSKPTTKQRFSLSYWNSLNDKKQGNKPTPYDVLACLQKYDPGTFENFCGDFGYDEDSRKAYTTYKAVVQQWHKVQQFFTITELGELEEIQ